MGQTRPAVTLGFRRTVHFPSGQLRDPGLGPVNGPYTFGLALRLEDEPYALRVGFGNDIALDYPVTAVAACVSTSYGDGTNPTGPANWALLTTNAGGQDSSDDTPPASASRRDMLVRGNGGGPRVSALSWTDWTPISSVAPEDGSGRPILFLRASTPAWVTPRCSPLGNGFSETSASHGRDWILSIRPGLDAASAPAPRVSAFGRWGATPFYCIQYLSRRRGATVLWGGDSHYAGDSTAGSIDAFPLQSCLLVSSPSLPVTAANYAWGGSPSMVFMPILERMLDACKPQFLVLQGWTANDGSSEAAAEAYAARVMHLARKAFEQGTLPILVTRFSRETLARNTAERTNADQLRQQQLASRNDKMPVLDAAAVLDDPARPGAFRADLTTDGIHPNEAGHAAVANLLTPLLRLLTLEAARDEAR